MAAVVPPGSIQYEPHVLDNAPSPLLQTLPNYERQFRYHLQKAQAHLEVSIHLHYVAWQHCALHFVASVWSRG